MQYKDMQDPYAVLDFCKVALETTWENASLPAPSYVFVMGGFCVGKTHFIDNLLAPTLRFKVMDVDEKMYVMGFQAEYTTYNLERARREIGEEINSMQAHKQSMICVGTGVVTSRIINNLFQAYTMGYSVHVAYVYASDSAIELNNERRRLEDRRPFDDIPKLFETAERSRQSFEIIKDLSWLRQAVAFKNTPPAILF